MDEYQKQTWVDEVDSNENGYTIDGTAAQIVKIESGVTTPGSNFNAQRMNHMENGIFNASQALINNAWTGGAW